MVREWMPNGIVDHEAFHLTSDCKTQLRTTLIAHGIALGAKESDFMGSMQKAAEAFVAMKKIADGGKPAAVRKNLRSSIQRADRLLDSLNELDGNSRMLLSEADYRGVERLYENLESIIRALHEAYGQATQYPKSGALVEYHKYALVQGVSDALVRCFGVHPTTSRESLLEACVEVLYGAVAEKPEPSVHSLVERALKWMSTQ